MSGDWIQSYSGLKVTPLNLQVDQVRLEDIAHALSMKSRFTGHTREFYSVAQHCVLGSRLLQWSLALPFLLHEISEVYLPDIATPLKRHVFVATASGEMSWEQLENTHAMAILMALGHQELFPLLSCGPIKAMDSAMLLAERDQLLTAPPEDWGIPGAPAVVSIRPWDPSQARDEFVEEYFKLTGSRRC